MRKQIHHRITALILLLTILMGNSWSISMSGTGSEDSVSSISKSEIESPVDHGTTGAISFFSIVEESEIELEDIDSYELLSVAVIAESSLVVTLGSLSPESECHEPMEREKYLLFHALTLYS